MDFCSACGEITKHEFVEHVNVFSPKELQELSKELQELKRWGEIHREKILRDLVKAGEITKKYFREEMEKIAAAKREKILDLLNLLGMIICRTKEKEVQNGK